MALYSFSAAIAEPLADKKIVNVLEQIAGTFKVLLAIVFCIAALLIIGIAIVLKISNTGLMLRLTLVRCGGFEGGEKMVGIINSWAQKIIIAVIICTIIEMILPEGKNKKYIKTVIGIYVVFTIISPIISKINNNNTLDLNKYFKTEKNITLETSSPVVDTNEYIEEVYKEKLKTDIKTKIEAMNYSVKNIDLEIETEDEETYGTILKLNLSISQEKEDKQNNIQIEKIVIGEEKKEESDISDKEKEKIKQYISSIYYVPEDNVIIY